MTGKNLNHGLVGSIDRYLQGASARGLSHKTITGYHTSLRRSLLPWCAEHGVTTLFDLDQDAVDRYAIYLQTREPPLTRESQRTYLKPVQLLLAWGREHGLAREATAPLPQQRKVHREVLSRQDLDRLEDAAQSDRDRLMIRVMGDTGAREGEVARLRITDLVRHGNHWFLHLRGKTGERECPITGELADRLRMYIASSRPKAPTDAMFLSRYRIADGGFYAPLTGDGIYQAFREVAHVAGLHRRIYPHLLRHSAITHMVARGVHPALISEATGVSPIVIARNYSHPSAKQLADALLTVWADD